MDLHVYRNSHDRWHELRTAARTRGAVLASNALTLHELVERLTPEVRTITPGQRLVLAERASEGRLPVRYVADAIADLKASGVGPEDLSSAREPVLAGILKAYNRAAAAHGLLDPEDRCWLAAARAAEGSAWLSRFDSVVLHALYDLDDAEFTLLRNLFDRLPGGGTVLLFNTTANVKPTQFAEWTWSRFLQDESLADKTLPEFFHFSGPASPLLERLFVFDEAGGKEPLAPSGRLQILHCADRYREVETIGAEISKLLEDGANPGDIAVVVRHVDAYGEMIEDVFTRYQIDHAFETGVPLLRIPFIKYWLAFLDLVAGERQRDALARVMSSAYYSPRLTPASDPERILCQIGYIDRRHLRASALAARRESPLTAELERLEALLDRLEVMKATPLQFLYELQPVSGIADRDREAWTTLLEEIEAIDPLAGELSFQDFRKFVSEIAGLRTVDRFSGRFVPPGMPRVRIFGPWELGYVPYPVIFAPGFTDGEIPAGGGSNPLLPDSLVEDLNRMVRPRHLMTSRDRNRREPLYLFLMLEAASERVTLTFPGSTLEGEPLYPSIYVGEILRHFDPPPLSLPAPHPPRETGECLREIARAWQKNRIDETPVLHMLGPEIMRRAELERRGALRADLGAGALALDNVWSPSELNALSQCPFVFLARYRLRVRPRELPDFEVMPSEVGTMAHRILREFYSAPIGSDEQAAKARMEEIIARQLAPVDIHGQGPFSVIDPSLWRIRRPQLVRALLEYVVFAVRDATDGFETLPEYLDRPLPAAEFAGVQLAGRPDHVAVRRHEGKIRSIRIDDFKYSAASSGMGKLLQKSFQIPVYAYLAARSLDAGSDVSLEGRYLLLRSPSSPVVASALDSAVLDDIRERIQGLVRKAAAGRLHADPADRQDCASCDYRRLCRVHAG